MKTYLDQVCLWVCLWETDCLDLLTDKERLSLLRVAPFLRQGVLNTVGEENVTQEQGEKVNKQTKIYVLIHFLLLTVDAMLLIFCLDFLVRMGCHLKL